MGVVTDDDGIRSGTVLGDAVVATVFQGHAVLAGSSLLDDVSVAVGVTDGVLCFGVLAKE